MTNKYEDRLADYVQVNERVIKFYEKYPEGSIQSEMVSLTDALVVFKAYAYRERGDIRPGIGHSSLAIPGTTPYTRGSEVENCETSAWGRALAALGFEVKRGIASRDEIDNKQKSDDANPSIDEAGKATLKDRSRLWKVAKETFAANGAGKNGQETEAEAGKWLEGRLAEMNLTPKTMLVSHVLLLERELKEFSGSTERVEIDQDLDF